MQYVSLVNSLWRDKRALQAVNVMANAVAMVLVFTIAEVMLAQSAEGDSSSPAGIMIICLVCAMAVTKIVADHAFTAQWKPLMRLRLTGASPLKLMVGVVAVQLKLSVYSAVVGSVCGVLLVSPINLIYRGIDMHIPAFRLSVALPAAGITVLASAFCTSVGAALSSWRIVSAVPDLTVGKVTAVRHRRPWFTGLLAVALVVGTGFAAVSDYSSSNIALGFLLCFVWGWLLVRGAGFVLKQASARVASLTNNNVLLLAFRNLETATSTALFTLAAIASVLLGTVYSVYGYTDADARASLSTVMGSDTSVVSGATLRGADFTQAVQRSDSNALILSETTAVSKWAAQTGCAQQIQQYGVANNARTVSSGHISTLIPRDTVVQGSLEATGGVVALAQDVNDDGDAIALGDMICVAVGDGTRELPVVAIAKLPAALGEYFVLDRAAVASPNSNALALISNKSARALPAADFNVESASEWIRHLAPGKAASVNGGNGLSEAAPIVYPVLAICLIGAVSVVFDLIAERKKEALAARLIVFGAWRYAAAGALYVLVHMLSASLLGTCGSVLVMNLCLRSESQVFYGGISSFVPTPQIIGLLLMVCAVGLLALVVHGLSYRKSLPNA